ncbi:hypothetical protein B0H11DRAFT_2204715 [Mycena galericulata]|nr:hypothetical protein B0H11DRAFT_2204715 [Mycena galericulata]
MSPGGEFFSAQANPNFAQMATWWSSHANGKTVFYKLKEHLESHHKVWKGLRKTQESLASSRDQRKPSRKRIRSATHVSHVLPAAARDNPGIIPEKRPLMPPILEPPSPIDVTFPPSSIPSDNYEPELSTVLMNTLDTWPGQVTSQDLAYAPVLGPNTGMEYLSSAGTSQTLPSTQWTFQPSFWPEPAGNPSQMSFVSYSGPSEARPKRKRKCAFEDLNVQRIAEPLWTLEICVDDFRDRKNGKNRKFEKFRCQRSRWGGEEKNPNYTKETRKRVGTKVRTQEQQRGTCHRQRPAT